jgi:dTDP-4-dehydrorhamnose 3,5-epimerase
MIFKELDINGVFEIELEPNQDSRGFFSRVFCKDQMSINGINNEVYHINNSYNKYSGTVRGMHYQINEYAETKILRCISGKVINAIVDLRKNSPTFCQYTTIVLDSKIRNMSYVPTGFANGIQTLEDNSELIYFASAAYNPEFERGIRWDDPCINIKWPREITNISEKDLSHPNFDKDEDGV